MCSSLRSGWYIFALCDVNITDYNEGVVADAVMHR
jgi:hypothetical protein